MQVAGLIGDVVSSRQAPDRAALQEALVGVLEAVSDLTGSELTVTLGDEFQGRFPDLASALHASWELHVRLVGTAALRIGIGWGEIVVEAPGEGPFGQDGPAWWRARDAIETVDMSHPSRTVVVTETDWDQFLNDYLALRDANLDELDPTDAAILTGLASGRTQRSVAGELDLHESSVSRRVSSRNLDLLLRVSRPRLPEFHG